MKYTKNDLYEGMKVKCVYTTDTYWWKVGKEYNVGKRTDGTFILKDETGYVWNKWLILDFLNGKGHCKMEIVEEEKVGTLEAIEAKIEQLENEQKNLYNKRKRIEKQEEALYDKRMKLKEAKKAFEFLKQQNYL